MLQLAIHGWLIYMEGLLFSEGKGEGVDGSDVGRDREERREGEKTLIGLEKTIDQSIKRRALKLLPISSSHSSSCLGLRRVFNFLLLLT